MKYRWTLFTALILSLLCATSVHASAVRGCAIQAEVLAVNLDNGEVSFELEVIKSESIGHSAGRSFCGDSGDKITFEVDNDAEVLSDKVKVGEFIEVERRTVYNVSGGTKRSFSSAKYKKRFDKRPETPAPVDVPDVDGPVPTEVKEPTPKAP